MPATWPSLGIIALALLLIFFGIFSLVPGTPAGIDVVFKVWAVVAGALLLVGR